VDWLELPLPEPVPVLRRNRNITVGIADPLGNLGVLIMNHLDPPNSLCDAFGVDPWAAARWSWM
jgi:hypothetical protein